MVADGFVLAGFNMRKPTTDIDGDKNTLVGNLTFSSMSEYASIGNQLLVKLS